MSAATAEMDIAADDPVDAHSEIVRVPTSQQVVRGMNLHLQLRDPTIEASRTRIIDRNDPDMPVVGEELTSMGEMIVRADGGSLRTFSGRQAHENGWWPAYKRRRLQHWQGSAQRNALMVAECDFRVNWAQTEARRFRFRLGRWREYTCDLEVDMFDAPTEIWEVKRDDRALEDPDYRLTLAGVDEICRRIGMRFRIVMADEIFADRHHRDNVELVASRRFVGVEPQHLRRLDAFAIRNGRHTTYGELANVVEPSWPTRGRAIVQGLVVRRRVEIDLTKRLIGRTPVTIH
jgi:hypothetical protein